MMKDLLEAFLSVDRDQKVPADGISSAIMLEWTLNNAGADLMSL